MRSVAEPRAGAWLLRAERVQGVAFPCELCELFCEERSDERRCGMGMRSVRSWEGERSQQAGGLCWLVGGGWKVLARVMAQGQSVTIVTSLLYVRQACVWAVEAEPSLYMGIMHHGSGAPMWQVQLGRTLACIQGCGDTRLLRGCQDCEQ